MCLFLLLLKRGTCKLALLLTRCWAFCGRVFEAVSKKLGNLFACWVVGNVRYTSLKDVWQEQMQVESFGQIKGVLITQPSTWTKCGGSHFVCPAPQFQRRPLLVIAPLPPTCNQTCVPAIKARRSADCLRGLQPYKYVCRLTICHCTCCVAGPGQTLCSTWCTSSPSAALLCW